MDTWFPTFRRLTSSSFERGGPRWTWVTTTSQRLALLRLIAVSIEENVPLIPLLENWAKDEGGAQRQRLERLLRLLHQGRSLPDALEEVPKILRDEDLLAVRFDAQMGTRTAAIRHLLAGPSDAAAQPALRVRRALTYFCTVVPLSLGLIAFSQVFIMPKVERVFAEYPLDAAAYMSWPRYLFGPFTAGGGVGLILAIILVIVLFATRSGRGFRQAMFGRTFRSVHELRSADVLQKLAVALEAGRPIAGALSVMARYHYDPVTRQKLLFLRNELEQGADLWHSMSMVRMLTAPEAALLRTSQSSGNRAWVLSELVSVKRRQTLWRLERATVFVLPGLVLLLGIIVLVQSLSVFGPLVQFIEAHL